MLGAASLRAARQVQDIIRDHEAKGAYDGDILDVLLRLQREGCQRGIVRKSPPLINCHLSPIKHL